MGRRFRALAVFAALILLLASGSGTIWASPPATFQPDGTIVFGTSIDGRHNLHHIRSAFGPTDHFSWRAQFLDDVKDKRVKREILDSHGHIIFSIYPFHSGKTIGYAWGDFPMKTFRRDDHIRKAGTYTMRYFNGREKLAEGTFTIK